MSKNKPRNETNPTQPQNGSSAVQGGTQQNQQKTTQKTVQSNRSGNMQ